jgi:HEAT repeat protein
MRSSDEWMTMALESPRADERRKGVVGLSQSGDASADWALRVYDTVARSDVDPMVRCAALNAIERLNRENAAPIATAILISKDDAKTDIRLAPASVRWAAARVLHTVGSSNADSLSNSDATKSALIDAAKSDASHEVRLTAIDCLGFMRDRRVPPILIDLLENEDFAIRRAAESSLVALTGVTHRFDAVAWRAWLSGVGDPFARAGETPPGYEKPSQKPKWDWLGMPGAG